MAYCVTHELFADKKCRVFERRSKVQQDKVWLLVYKPSKETDSRELVVCIQCLDLMLWGNLLGRVI